MDSNNTPIRSCWTCPTCTLENPARRRRCGACESRKPVTVKAAADTNCLDGAAAAAAVSKTQAHTTDPTASSKPVMCNKHNDRSSSLPLLRQGDDAAVVADWLQQRHGKKRRRSRRRETAETCAVVQVHVLIDGGHRLDDDRPIALVAAVPRSLLCRISARCEQLDDLKEVNASFSNERIIAPANDGENSLARSRGSALYKKEAATNDPGDGVFVTAAAHADLAPDGGQLQCIPTSLLHNEQPVLQLMHESSSHNDKPRQMEEATCLTGMSSDAEAAAADGPENRHATTAITPRSTRATRAECDLQANENDNGMSESHVATDHSGYSDDARDDDHGRAVLSAHMNESLATSSTTGIESAVTSPENAEKEGEVDPPRRELQRKVAAATGDHGDDPASDDPASDESLHACSALHDTVHAATTSPLPRVAPPSQNGVDAVEMPVGRRHCDPMPDNNALPPTPESALRDATNINSNTPCSPSCNTKAPLELAGSHQHTGDGFHAAATDTAYNDGEAKDTKLSNELAPYSKHDVPPNGGTEQYTPHPASSAFMYSQYTQTQDSSQPCHTPSLSQSLTAPAMGENCRSQSTRRPPASNGSSSTDDRRQTQTPALHTQPFAVNVPNSTLSLTDIMTPDTAGCSDKQRVRLESLSSANDYAVTATPTQESGRGEEDRRMPDLGANGQQQHASTSFCTTGQARALGASFESLAGAESLLNAGKEASLPLQGRDERPSAVHSGFYTAGQSKVVEISAQSLTRVEQLWREPSGTHESREIDPTDLPADSDKKLRPAPVASGFATAGKAVRLEITDTALARAESLLKVAAECGRSSQNVMLDCEHAEHAFVSAGKSVLLAISDQGRPKSEALFGSGTFGLDSPSVPAMFKVQILSQSSDTADKPWTAAGFRTAGRRSSIAVSSKSLAQAEALFAAPCEIAAATGNVPTPTPARNVYDGADFKPAEKSTAMSVSDAGQVQAESLFPENEQNGIFTSRSTCTQAKEGRAASASQRSPYLEGFKTAGTSRPVEVSEECVANGSALFVIDIGDGSNARLHETNGSGHEEQTAKLGFKTAGRCESVAVSSQSLASAEFLLAGRSPDYRAADRVDICSPRPLAGHRRSFAPAGVSTAVSSSDMGCSATNAQFKPDGRPCNTVSRDGALIAGTPAFRLAGSSKSVKISEESMVKVSTVLAGQTALTNYQDAEDLFTIYKPVFKFAGSSKHVQVSEQSIAKVSAIFADTTASPDALRCAHEIGGDSTPTENAALSSTIAPRPAIVATGLAKTVDASDCTLNIAQTSFDDDTEANGFCVAGNEDCEAAKESDRLAFLSLTDAGLPLDTNVMCGLGRSDQRVSLAEQPRLDEITRAGEDAILPNIATPMQSRLPRVSYGLLTAARRLRPRDKLSCKFDRTKQVHAPSDACPLNNHHQILLRVTAGNALQLQFDECSGLAACFSSIASPGNVGVQRMFEILLSAMGTGVSLTWTENHFRWVTWKLACIERKHADDFPGRVCNVSMVQLQLLRRLSKENLGCRSAVRELLNGDLAPASLIVLCVAQIIELGAAPENGNEVGRQRYRFELTDSWYSMEGRGDLVLDRAVSESKICIGTKLVISCAQLVGANGGCDPLDPAYAVFGHNSPHLLLFGNGTKVACHDTRLGMHSFGSGQSPFRLRALRDIIPGGGIVPMINVRIARRSSLMYLEKLKGQCSASRPATTILSEAEMTERLAAGERRKIAAFEARGEAVYAAISEEVDEDAPEIWQRLVKDPCPDDFYAGIPAEDKASVDDWATRRLSLIHNRAQQNLESLMEDEDNGADYTCFMRTTVESVDRQCLADAIAEATLTVWEPKPALLEILHVGATVQCSYLSVKADTFDGRLQLSSSSRSTFRLLLPAHDQTEQFTAASTFISIARIRTMLDPDGHPINVPLDVVGIVVDVRDSGCDETMLVLVDESGCLLQVHIADATLLDLPSNVEELVEPDNFVAVELRRFTLKHIDPRTGYPIICSTDISHIGLVPARQEARLRRWHDLHIDSIRSWRTRSASGCTDAPRLELLGYIAGLEVLLDQHLLMHVDDGDTIQGVICPLSVLPQLMHLTSGIRGLVALNKGDEERSRALSSLGNAFNARSCPLRFQVHGLDNAAATTQGGAQLVSCANVDIDALCETYLSAVT